MVYSTVTLDHLDEMDAADLRKAWKADVGRSPPKRASEKYMHSVLAYRIQERTGPKLTAATKRKLERIAQGEETGADFRSGPGQNFKSGMKLLREWNGVTHEVPYNPIKVSSKRAADIGANALKVKSLL
jgi:hypothetical protein